MYHICMQTKLTSFKKSRDVRNKKCTETSNHQHSSVNACFGIEQIIVMIC